MALQDTLAIETISVVALAFIGLVLGIKKIFKELRLSEAGDTIMKLMHEELERMSAQNTLLSTELNKLQQEIIKLNTQLRQLCIENDKLQTEVVALTNQLDEFKKIRNTKNIED
jgi:regulator of replication initiation timing